MMEEGVLSGLPYSYLELQVSVVILVMMEEGVLSSLTEEQKGLFTSES